VNDFWTPPEVATLPLNWQPSANRSGKVSEVVGTLIRASGLDAVCGELCELRERGGRLLQYAEVVGFSSEHALLMPMGGTGGLARSTLVVGTGRSLQVRVGPALLGRVVDVLGTPLDGRGPIETTDERPLMCPPPDPMQRPLIAAPLYTGVRCVDALLTLGEGQRMGIFAPAGTGKSTLLAMFARGARCDVIVIALIGERGREVREFVERVLGPESMRRSVVVCATSDRSAVERAKAAHVGTAIAEYFRDQGARVLLMMDSVTRFARAQREIGLAAGEPPTRRGFPPSIFAELPRLLERPGLSPLGSITALYTVLAEDDTGSDPIAEEVRGILDGHMVLSREIAARNHYPAIDVTASLSRVMGEVADPHHMHLAGRLRRSLSLYQEVETLLRIGEYQGGSDAETDEAIARHKDVQAFLAQPVTEVVDFYDTLDMLESLVP